MKKETPQENKGFIDPKKVKWNDDITTHKCDGGDDYGLVDCKQCEGEMLRHLTSSATSRPQRR